MSEPRHQHWWTQGPTGEWVCTDCGETCATCGTCGRATGGALLLCDPCHARERQVLADIEHAIGLYLPSPGRSPYSSARMDAMRVAGSKAARVTDPEDSIDSTLFGWVALWTEASGDAQNLGALEYLAGHLLWAAHNPDASRWEAYRKSIRAQRGAARRVAQIAPQPQPAPCIHCGGKVVQDWADHDWNPLKTGLSDVHRCTGCGTTWGDHAHWRFAQRHTIFALPTDDPDRLVTLADARTIFPDVPAGTWRTWIKRSRDEHARTVAECDAWDDRWTAYEDAGYLGPIPEAPEIVEAVCSRGETDQKVKLYRLGDLDALAMRRVSETRRGRPASAMQLTGSTVC
ncbi:hypothetical protein [Occultella gossypii]|uniref:Uncharacterized protein n=1 Tax=Occultella gossypii TaxID=2800820 RepID=A0ABS7SA95_9MICO|nr:hypothetical protein [Occultella gossypii]MBZ2197264.1 hypothetical protein [Occultella gossypii]